MLLLISIMTVGVRWYHSEI